MSERVWMSDLYGVKAHVDPAAVDEWRPRGWAMSTAPAGIEMAWCHHEETGGRAKFPAAVLDAWAALGWAPSEPPEPVDLTKDPKLVDQHAEPAQGGVGDLTAEQTDTQTTGRRPRAGRQSETQE